MEIYDFETYHDVLDKGGFYHNIRNTPWYCESVYPRFSEAEFDRRRTRLREAMAERDLDCLIVCGGQSNWSQGGALLWLSGLIDTRSMGQYALLPRKGESLLVYAMGGAHAELARRTTTDHEVQPAQRGQFAAILVERVKALGLEAGRIGLLPCIDGPAPEYLPQSQMAVLREGLPQATFVRLPDLFHSLARRKSEEELVAYGTAGELAVRALEAVVARAAPGVREYELAAAATRVIFAAGGQPDFVRVGSTPGVAPALTMANPLPSGRALQSGDVLLVEVSAGLRGVTAQLGQAFSLGPPAPAVSQFWQDVVLPGFHRLETQLTPGTPLAALQQAGAFFREAGHQSAPLLLHGLDIQASNPRVFVQEIEAAPFEQTLQPGMVVVLRANPIRRDGQWGLCLSRTYAIAESGRQLLTPFPEEMAVLESRVTT